MQNATGSARVIAHNHKNFCPEESMYIVRFVGLVLNSIELHENKMTQTLTISVQ